MFELLRRMWVQGIIAETRVRAAIAGAVTRGVIKQEEAEEILRLPRNS